jgi:hypothetical protein
MALIDIQWDAIRFTKLSEAFPWTQGVLMRVAQYPQCIWDVQMVCNHARQIIDLQRQITKQQVKQCLPR